MEFSKNSHGVRKLNTNVNQKFSSIQWSTGQFWRFEYFAIFRRFVNLQILQAMNGGHFEKNRKQDSNYCDNLEKFEKKYLKI